MQIAVLPKKYVSAHQPGSPRGILINDELYTKAKSRATETKSSNDFVKRFGVNKFLYAQAVILASGIDVNSGLDILSAMNIKEKWMCSSIFKTSSRLTLLAIEDYLTEPQEAFVEKLGRSLSTHISKHRQSNLGIALSLIIGGPDKVLNQSEVGEILSALDGFDDSRAKLTLSLAKNGIINRSSFDRYEQ